MDIRTTTAGLDLLARLPWFLNRRFTIDEARAIQAHQLRGRPQRFLRFLRKGIYAFPHHPVHQLLKHAGCTYGDLATLVEQDGVEETLQRLLQSGVYLTVDEFKGRRPAVRGSTTIDVDPVRLRNPLAAFHIPSQSGGSRSAGTPVIIDLAFVRASAVAYALSLHVRGGDDWLKVNWETPGGGTRFRLLKMSCFGARPVAWFSQLDPAASAKNRNFRWGERALRLGALLGGVRLPPGQLASLEDPLPLLHWIRAALDRGETPHLETFPSSIVRLARSSLETGIDIRGTKATLGGEPITQARLDLSTEAGIQSFPRYGSMETGPVSYACLNPKTADDTHVLRDLHAVIQAGDQSEQIGLPSRALLITNLHPAAPFAMVNFSMGDEADMAERDCGCPLEQLGWNPHLTNVRSYEKLTAGGVTFYDSDLIDVLERVLPTAFGGHPADYQLVEREDSDGRPRMVLVVHPRLGPLDEALIEDAFLRAIDTSPLSGLMASMWRESRVVHVERRAPHTTATSKILHLHVDRTRSSTNQ